MRGAVAIDYREGIILRESGDVRVRVGAERGELSVAVVCSAKSMSGQGLERPEMGRRMVWSDARAQDWD